MATELIGRAAAILLATIGGRSTLNGATARSKGSKWLFVGQIIVSNVLLLGMALLGQWIYLHNNRDAKLAR
jgi:hypothetical protein